MVGMLNSSSGMGYPLNTSTKCWHEDGDKVYPALKHKSFVFCALEGICKNDEDYVDTEEVA